MRLLQIAWRNAKRQPRRTGLTAAIVALGVAALQFAWAVFDAGNSQMIDNMTSTFVSHVQVHGRGYDANPSIERTFKAEEVERTLVGDGRVQSSAPRLEGGVLISGAENARGILLVGVDPLRESQVTRIKERIVEGRYLQPEESGGVLLGQTLARSLGVKVGDEIAVVTEALHGAVGAGRYTVRGLFSTGNELIDRMQAHVSLQDARNLFGVENEITSLAIRLVDRSETDRVSATLNSRLGKSYEALGWPKLLPSVAQSIEFHKSMAAIIMVVLFSIVIIGVANALMMAVHERTREYGVMGALGTPPAWMFRTILYEGMLTGALGFAVGGILGSLLVGYFAHFGLNFSGKADAFKTMQGGSSGFYLIWSADRLLMLAVIVLVVTIVGSLYPAWRVARLTPVSAMKGITSLAAAPKSISQSERIPLTLLLAWRNLLRQPVRTMLTIGAISMGLAAIIFLGSFANGYTKQAVDNVTGLITGDAQILRPEFRIDAKASLAFEGEPALDAARRTPGVVAATGRVQIEGTLSTAKQFKPALLFGVDPERETRVTFLH
ncbi:MAG TPA: ABC transporter permease, partial [Burkholderiales bacterium]|nr:ABC transporter permease [Burkholderiales bacterium]